MPDKPLFSSKTFSLFLLLGIAINAGCFFSKILEPDGALYATIARHIAESGDWLNLWSNGADWLDKPHLPFWLTALSFKVFGISSFAYKLPSFICWLTGVVYCYKLARKMYNTQIAKLAVLIYVTALHVILSNADVRAEGFLTTFIVAGTYYIYLAYTENKLLYLLLAALSCACAIMTKGIFTVIAIAGGFIVYWIRNKDWKEFVQPRWYLLIGLTLIFILPELYSLYRQFDLHPEKIVFGQTHVSGIRFFFWDSQFGRFMNNGPIKGSGDLFFFVHTTLWAFLPWSFILLASVIAALRKRKKDTGNHRQLIIAGNAVVTFLLFSFSRFQLPHYIVIIFPFLAMLVANWLLNNATAKALSVIDITQGILYLILAMLVILLVYLSGFNNLYLTIALCLLIPAAIVSKSEEKVLAIVKKSFAFSLLLTIFLNCIFYRSLLTYQAGMEAGKWMNRHYKGKPVQMYRCTQYTFQFYYKGPIAFADTSSSLWNQPDDSTFVYTSSNSISVLEQQLPANKKIAALRSFSNFHVSQVTLPFLNKNTRASVLDTMMLAVITGKEKL